MKFGRDGFGRFEFCKEACGSTCCPNILRVQVDPAYDFPEAGFISFVAGERGNWTGGKDAVADFCSFSVSPDAIVSAGEFFNDPGCRSCFSDVEVVVFIVIFVKRKDGHVFGWQHGLESFCLKQNVHVGGSSVGYSVKCVVVFAICAQ